MTVVYLDDSLVTGRCLEEHLQNLEVVIQRLANSGLRLKLAKCAFMQKEISYLGHTINSQGLAPDKKKVMTIQAAPEPKSVTELRSFLGTINYYGRFLPKLASRLAPLYQLLRQNVRWQWKDEHKEAFRRAKEALQSIQVIIHFDPRKEVIVACDASP